MVSNMNFPTVFKWNNARSISLRATCRSLQEQKTELEAKKSDLEKEAKSIEEQKKYMQTNEYIEEMAREKFGLVYDDEIVFKAK